MLALSQVCAVMPCVIGPTVIMCVQHSAWMEEVRLFRGRGEEVGTPENLLSQNQTNVGQHS
jgi:hypothetical protein